MTLFPPNTVACIFQRQNILHTPNIIIKDNKFDINTNIILILFKLILIN